MTAPARERTVLAQALPDDVAVVLTPVGARYVAEVLARYSRAEGVPMSAALRNLHDVCRRVATKNRGTAEHDGGSDVAPSTHDADEIPAAEAAELLGLTREYVGRLALSDRLGPTRLVGGRRMVSRAEVLALQAQRTQSHAGPTTHQEP